MKSTSSASYYRKYREILLAVALFLAFDISVLVLNFYTSFQIDQDAVAINLSGRQRYVSQRVARTLLEFDAARAAGKPYRPATLDELRKGANIFQISMTGFVYFSAPRRLMRELLVQMHQPDVCEQNLLDAVGEVANTILGNARRHFGGVLEISVPIAIKGAA